MIERVATETTKSMFQKNVIMLHIGRCGSTVVSQLLIQHPDIHWSKELYSPIFLEWQRKNMGKETIGQMPEDAISYLQKDMKEAHKRIYGFEMKPFHFRLVGYSAKSYIHQLSSLDFNNFILLDRKNRLRKIVSSLIARKRGRYHIEHQTKAKLTKVHVNVDDVRIDFDSKPLIKYLSDYDKEINRLKKFMKEKRVLQLTYEDDIQEDPQKAFERICEFLGLQTSNATITLSRVNPFPIRDMIDNFKEVQEILANSPYEWMLEE